MEIINKVPDCVIVGTVKDTKMLLPEIQTYLWKCEVNFCEEHHMSMDKDTEVRVSLNNSDLDRDDLKEGKKIGWWDNASLMEQNLP